MQRRRRAREGERPVPHYWDHVMWVWGAPDLDAFMETASRVHLDGVLDRIRVPFLVTHGENDRQIPLEYARRSFDALVNSPQRALMVFTQRQGGAEHSSLDNMANAGDAIADWLAGTLRRPHRRGRGTGLRQGGPAVGQVPAPIAAPLRSPGQIAC